MLLIFSGMSLEDLVFVGIPTTGMVPSPDDLMTSRTQKNVLGWPIAAI